MSAGLQAVKCFCFCVSGDKGDALGCPGVPGDKGPPGDLGSPGDHLILEQSAGTIWFYELSTYLVEKISYKTLIHSEQNVL